MATSCRLVAAWVVLGAVCACGQNATLTGTISGPDGSRVAAAVVQITGAPGAPARVVSSAKGQYRVGIPEGTYEISIAVPCCQYSATKVSGVQLRRGEAKTLDIRLPWGSNLGAEGDDPILLLDEFRKRAPVTTGPAPRMNGKPDLSGIWINVFNPDSAPPPLQPWADALHKKRQAENSKDYPGAYCLPANAASITRAFPYKIVQTPKLVVFLYESDTPGPRQVFLDGRAHPKPDTPAGDPTWHGHSIGHWERDTLVIDTTNFNDKAWLSLSGIPHTEQLHTVERLHRLDAGHLEVEITMEDPGAFTSPWVRTFTATMAPKDEEILEFICNENNRDAGHYR